MSLDEFSPIRLLTRRGGAGSLPIIPAHSRASSGDIPEAEPGAALRPGLVTPDSGDLRPRHSGRDDLGARSSLYGSRAASADTASAAWRLNKCRGGAPRGERPTSLGARRLARCLFACLRYWHAPVRRIAPARLGASPPRARGDRKEGAARCALRSETTNRDG